MDIAQNTEAALNRIFTTPVPRKKPTDAPVSQKSGHEKNSQIKARGEHSGASDNDAKWDHRSARFTGRQPLPVAAQLCEVFRKQTWQVIFCGPNPKMEVSVLGPCRSELIAKKLAHVCSALICKSRRVCFQEQPVDHLSKLHMFDSNSFRLLEESLSEGTPNEFIETNRFRCGSLPSAGCQSVVTAPFFV